MLRDGGIPPEVAQPSWLGRVAIKALGSYSFSDEKSFHVPQVKAQPAIRFQGVIACEDGELSCRR